MDILGCRAPSVFCSVNQYFAFRITNAMNTSHKYCSAKWTISEIVGNSVLYPSQNPFNKFL